MWLKTLWCWKSDAVYPWSQLAPSCKWWNRVWPLSVLVCKFQGSFNGPVCPELWPHRQGEADPWEWALESWLSSFPHLFHGKLPTAGPGEQSCSFPSAPPVCPRVGQAPPPLPWSESCDIPRTLHWDTELEFLGNLHFQGCLLQQAGCSEPVCQGEGSCKFS